MKKLILFNIFLAFAWVTWAQNVNLTDLNAQRLQKQRVSMLVLGGWAVGNIAVGSVLAGQREGVDKNFHLMNAGWNVVNLGLATLGYINAVKTDPSSLDLYATIEAQNSIEKILLLNTGLDVGYMLGGLYLIERSKNATKNPERLEGFGKSIILQGGFLFAFDLVTYFVHTNTRSGVWQDMLTSVYFDGSQVGLVLQF